MVASSTFLCSLELPAVPLTGFLDLRRLSLFTNSTADFQGKSTLCPLTGTGVCFEPKFATFAPGLATRRIGDACAPILYIPGGPIFHRHRISIRMNLVYAAAKKIDGKAIRPAIPAQTLPRESTSDISRGAETTSVTA